MISITFPAKYKCNNCGELLHEVTTDYQRKGRYYYVRDACPLCKSTNVELVTLLTRLTTPQQQEGE